MDNGTQLKRKLGMRATIAISSGMIIGAGIFVSSGNVRMASCTPIIAVLHDW